MSQLDNSSYDSVCQERDLYKKQYLKVQTNYEQKIKELSVIKEMAEALRSQNIYEPNVFFYHQLKIIANYTGLAYIALMLVNEERWALSMVARTDLEGPVIHPELLPLDEGVPGRVVSQKNTVVILPHDNSDAMSEKSAEDESRMYVPIIHNRESIGVLSLRQGGWKNFDQDHIRFFTLVADQIATAVILSRMYHKMIREENRRFLLSRFFSKTVTEKILGGKEIPKLGGERRNAAIIFKDLHGFTSISELMNQESVVDILNAYFSEMTPIIFQHDGTLDKLMGDGMMAVFGAPISREDDIVRAVRAVIEMNNALKKFNLKNRIKNWPQLKASVGVNWGEVVAGYIGSEDHLNYTVIGDAVNVAQRLQSIAGPDEILISQPVRDHIIHLPLDTIGIARITALPKQKLKGKQHPINAYRIEIKEQE